MPFLTNDDIEKRRADGVKMTHLNQGWNLPPNILLKAATIINEMNPKTKAEKRDKHILQLAFIEDMNASQIARLNDPLIVGAGNRSRDKPLSPASILEICYKYLPEAKQRKYKGAADKTKRQRNELYRERLKGGEARPKVCSTCGNPDNIELHHIIPIAAGGTNDYYNLIYMCHGCHMKLHHTIYNSVQWKRETKEK